MIAYHDREWGIPVHDDTVLFEFLILEGAQAGLSWSTILAKRENYRKAFARFDPARVARFTEARIGRILRDPGIVRNRLKVRGAVRNARAFLRIAREFGTFDRYVWKFAGGKPDALSADLKRRGMTFVGTTIVYSFMQAVGMVNGHSASCYRRSKC